MICWYGTTANKPDVLKFTCSIKEIPGSRFACCRGSSEEEEEEEFLLLSSPINFLFLLLHIIISITTVVEYVGWFVGRGDSNHNFISNSDQSFVSMSQGDPAKSLGLQFGIFRGGGASAFALLSSLINSLFLLLHIIISITSVVGYVGCLIGRG
jgi:hypothetical protein